MTSLLVYYVLLSYVFWHKANVKPSSFVCVDETLVGFRGRCPFRVYIPSKPHRYGIKIWSLCDNGTNYLCNLQVYLGKVGSTPEVHQGARVVADLAEPLFGSGRNITVDNFFTSYALGSLCWRRIWLSWERCTRTKGSCQSHFLSLGALNTNLYSPFTSDTTLVSHSPKKNRSVILMSTMHSRPEVDAGVQGCKPFMSLDYNASKGAVDAFDQCVSHYTCCRQTRRWPMRLFMFLVDAACYNAYVLWKLTSENPNKRVDRRRMFLASAGENLIRPFIEMRATVPTIYHIRLLLLVPWCLLGCNRCASRRQISQESVVDAIPVRGRKI